MGSLGGRADSVKILPREVIVEIACVNGTTSGSWEVGVMEVSAASEPGPGIWLRWTVLREGRCEVLQIQREYARGFLRGL